MGCPKSGRQAGYTLVEMMLVLLLLLIFGLTAFTLIFTGSDTYQRLIADKNQAADARIILSTLETRLRQYDTEGGVSVVALPWEAQTVNALVFHEAVGEDTLHTYLFWADGALWEGLTLNGEPLAAADATPLLKNEAMELRIDTTDGCIVLAVTYPFSQQPRTLQTSIYLRSQPDYQLPTRPLSVSKGMLL